VCSFEHILFQTGRLKTKKRTAVTKRRAVSITILPYAMRSPDQRHVDAGRDIVSGDGGRSVKSNSRRTVEFGLTGALSTDILARPKLRLCKTFALLAASALFCWAAFGLPQSAKSEESSQPQQIADDSAFSELTSFAQQIGAGTKTAQSSDRQFDDQTFAALRDFAQRVGSSQLESIKAQPKLAEADTLMDWLAGKGSSEAPAATSPKAPAAGGKRSSAPVEAHFIGSQACQTCHAPLIAEFQKTLMGKIGGTQKGKFECENCHGPGSAHVKAGGGRGVGGILSFGNDDPRSVEERNGICLACHQKGERNYWAGSVHETRGVACTNCHAVMKSVSRAHNLKTEVEAETCYQCHKIQRAQMQYSSHMPIREGKLTCSNCHNPHGSITDKLIREASVNDNCYKCHAEKRGPYLWEHAPVRESCLNCHTPHGSNYEYLLLVARPRLCNECHSTVHSPTAGGGLGTPNLAYTRGRACGNCHSNIHGSNHPNGVYFLR
jgi:DmsE family decaheme c-type cytochrome